MGFDNNINYWQNRYDTLGGERTVGNRGWDKKTYDKESEYTRENLQPYFSKLTDVNNLLDFGCGIGRFAPFLNQYCNQYHGCDIVNSTIEKNKNNFSDEYKFGVIKDSKIPFGNTKFDVIFTSVILQHVVNEDLLNYYMEQFRKRSRKYIVLCEILHEAKDNHYLKFRNYDNYKNLIENQGFELKSYGSFMQINEKHGIFVFEKIS